MNRALPAWTLLLCLTGACRMYWRIEDRGPVDRGRRVELVRVDYEGLRVGNQSEAEFLRQWDDQRWQQNKREWLARVRAPIAAHLEGRNETKRLPAYMASVTIDWIQRGFDAVIAAQPTIVRARLRVSDPEDRVVFVIAFEERVSGHGDRIAIAHEQLGRRIVEFLQAEL